MGRDAFGLFRGWCTREPSCLEYRTPSEAAENCAGPTDLNAFRCARCNCLLQEHKPCREQGYNPESAAHLEARRKHDVRLLPPEERAALFKARGDAAFKERNYRTAYIEYTRAIEATPENHLLLGNRCQAYLKTGKAELALDDAERATRLAPEWPKGYYRLGSCLQQVERHEEAVAAFEAAHGLEPDNKESRRALEEAKRKLAEWEKKQDSLVKARKRTTIRQASEEYEETKFNARHKAQKAGLIDSPTEWEGPMKEAFEKEYFENIRPPAGVEYALTYKPDVGSDGAVGEGGGVVVASGGGDAEGALAHVAALQAKLESKANGAKKKKTKKQKERERIPPWLRQPEEEGAKETGEDEDEDEDDDDDEVDDEDDELALEENEEGKEGGSLLLEKNVEGSSGGGGGSSQKQGGGGGGRDSPSTVSSYEETASQAEARAEAELLDDSEWVPKSSDPTTTLALPPRNYTLVHEDGRLHKKDDFEPMSFGMQRVHKEREPEPIWVQTKTARWHQSSEFVSIIPHTVPQHLCKASEIKVSFARYQVHVQALKGDRTIYMAGELEAPIDPGQSTWTTDGEYIVITCVKENMLLYNDARGKEADTHWFRLFKTDQYLERGMIDADYHDLPEDVRFKQKMAELERKAKEAREKEANECVVCGKDIRFFCDCREADKDYERPMPEGWKKSDLGFNDSYDKYSGAQSKLMAERPPEQYKKYQGGVGKFGRGVPRGGSGSSGKAGGASRGATAAAPLANSSWHSSSSKGQGRKWVDVHALD